MQGSARNETVPGSASLKRRWTLVAIQGGTLIPLTYLWLGPASEAAAASPEPDLAAGLVGLLLTVFGLPWSVFVCLLDNRYDLFDSPLRDLFVIGPAVFNLGLTAFGVWWTNRHPAVEHEWEIIEVTDADGVEVEVEAEPRS
ncbi:hypothetical protein KZ829_17125 [Actinoplanes hulinensis]|uniref:Uncharacterized protein n=1 Tax=Actinoplanes hulinensis TaxID=1144547 RepID=A0ABS7B356_9ACTN|nr:hypothetical protein [Actinoplanes hulinensis]MBW6435463.1 hypothetical protein [Actinoplanes hulinensis]